MNSSTPYRLFIRAFILFVALQSSLWLYFTRVEKIAGPWAKMLLHPFTLFFFICLAAFYFLRRFPLPVTTHQPPITNHYSLVTSHITSIGLFLLLFFLLIINNRYYFLQDDNYAQFSPVIIHGLDGWYNEGSFPTYNPWQLAGSPTYSYSTYAFLYPVTHISYLFSRFILNDVHQCCTVFAFIHFALGYWFCYRLLLRWNMHPALAIAAALSFVFCGFNLVAVRSWYYVAPTVFFLPAIFYSVWNRPVYSSSGKHIAWPIVLFTVYAYSGNFQYWVYSFLFFALFELCRQYKNGTFLKGLLFTGLVGIVSLLLFAPQLLATWHETRTLPRTGGMGAGILPGAGALVFPYLGKAQLPNGWGQGGLHHYDAFFYYGGFIFLLLALSFLLYRVMYKRFPLVATEQYPVTSFLWLLLLAFVLSLGAPGILWWLQAQLPVLNKFNHPFKLLLYVQFFGIVAGAVLLQQLMNRIPQLAVARMYYGVAAIIIFLLAVNVHNTQQAFYVYTYKKPYVQTDWAFHPENNYRVLPIGAVRSPDDNFSNSLQMNFPMVNQVASIDGYEPLNNLGPDLYRNHRAFGVRYFVVAEHSTEPAFYRQTEKDLEHYQGHTSFRKMYSGNKITVYEDSLCEPVVQLWNSSGKPVQPEKIIYRNNGIDIQTGNIPLQQVQLGFMYRKGMEVYYDNRKCRQVSADSLQRILVKDTGTAATIKLRYRPFPF